MLSFIVPAHNEEVWLDRSLPAIHTALVELNSRAQTRPIEYEIVVANDASTDRTAEVARRHGATVIDVAHRQIAATRNSGARASHGERLMFVDADTLVNATAVAAALEALDRGAAGGGCVFSFDGKLPLWARIMHPVAVFLARRLKLTGGCCLFCTRATFDTVGGFCEKYFAAEEAAFIAAVKKQGRFVIPGPQVVTSGRKLREFSMWKILKTAGRWALRGPAAYQHRDDVWYGERKHD